MSAILSYVLLAGVVSAALGLTLQALGRMSFTYFGGQDSKELAGVAGIRIAAVFGIAVGLIFSSSHSYYGESRKELIEEARIVGTLYVLAANTPNSRDIREKLRKYVEGSAMELDRPEAADQLADSTNEILSEICRPAPDLKMTASAGWFQAQLQTFCTKLIDLRGKQRIRMSVHTVETPFWIFFSISFCFLAFLFGAFEWRTLNLVSSALFYVAVGATAILIHWMGDPFHGPSRISSQPLTLLIAKMDAVDRK